MTNSLITDDRLRALSRINRWGGWVTRDFSVLEHEVIGAMILRSKGEPYKPFLIHDHEESEFGDIIAPVKAICSTTTYLLRVDEFNTRLIRETGIVPDGGWMDQCMAHAEHLTVAVRGDPKFNDMPLTNEVRQAVMMINGMRFAGKKNCIKMWKRLWYGDSV